MSSEFKVDVAANRKATKYTRKENAARVLWAFAKVIFRLIPRPFYRVRAIILSCFFCKIGARVHVSNTADIFAPWNLAIGDDNAIGNNAKIYNLGPMEIGSGVTVSQGVHLCGGSHDYNDPAMELLKLPITIEHDSWVCADAFVGPGVTIGHNAIVAARAVVTKNVDAFEIVGGNPAKTIKSREPVESQNDAIE